MAAHFELWWVHLEDTTTPLGDQGVFDQWLQLLSLWLDALIVSYYEMHLSSTLFTRCLMEFLTGKSSWMLLQFVWFRDVVVGYERRPQLSTFSIRPVTCQSPCTALCPPSPTWDIIPSTSLFPCWCGGTMISVIYFLWISSNLHSKCCHLLYNVYNAQFVLH